MTPASPYARHVERDAEQLARFRWRPDEYEYGHVALASASSAPSDGRRWAASLPAADTLTKPQHDAVMLVLSELVTNAVRHALGQGDAPVDVHFGVAADCIRLEVRDGGNGFAPGEVRPALDRVPGRRGLMVVDALATRWGTSTSGSCHCVWVEIDRFAPQLRAV